MDDKTKIAVVVLVAALLISALGSLAIAFACGYVVATVVNSPQFDHAALQNRLNRMLQLFRGKPVPPADANNVHNVPLEASRRKRRS